MKHVINNKELGELAGFHEPSLYRVLIHNDDFTPMEFVVEVLESIFYMSRERATGAMLEAHIEGKATCGSYPRDLAETKLEQMLAYAKRFEHPLTCSMEVANCE